MSTVVFVALGGVRSTVSYVFELSTKSTCACIYWQLASKLLTALPVYRLRWQQQQQLHVGSWFEIWTDRCFLEFFHTSLSVVTGVGLA
mmetsp:Transcript_66060/g.137978  ORF Transcript_66060/g.137978 Transcript_66060/m.137978 type:complete len:88 (+) Transcript_66060:1355-1618(+)